MDDRIDAFFEFAMELADGERWKLFRAEGWEDLECRLAETVADLPVRRRQALIMLLFALVDEIVEPEDVRLWVGDNDLGTDDGIEALIAWLRVQRLETRR